MIIATPLGAFNLPTDAAALVYPEEDGIIFVWLPETRQWAMCNGHTGKTSVLPFLSRG